MGQGDLDPAGDLDALIGEIRREAARRRAAPDFPLDEEARLSREMDAQGPTGGGADLAALIAELRSISPNAGDKRAPEIAALTASALAALAIRVAELERRTAPNRLPARLALAARRDPSPPSGRSVLDDVLFDHWIAKVSDVVPAGPDALPSGRVLVAGVERSAVMRWSAGLAAVGADVYGLDSGSGGADLGEGGGEPGEGPIRRGPILGHLRTVGRQALGLAVVVGPLASREAEGLADIAVELSRTAERVAVCSEAPWAWRMRIGEAATDTSRTRAVGPEAWIEALSAQGLEATAGYGPAGKDYLAVTATKRGS